MLQCCQANPEDEQDQRQDETIELEVETTQVIPIFPSLNQLGSKLNKHPVEQLEPLLTDGPLKCSVCRESFCQPIFKATILSITIQGDTIRSYYYYHFMECDLSCSSVDSSRLDGRSARYFGAGTPIASIFELEEQIYCIPCLLEYSKFMLDHFSWRLSNSVAIIETNAGCYFNAIHPREGKDFEELEFVQTKTCCECHWNFGHIDHCATAQFEYKNEDLMAIYYYGFLEWEARGHPSFPIKEDENKVYTESERIPINTPIFSIVEIQARNYCFSCLDRNVLVKFGTAFKDKMVLKCVKDYNYQYYIMRKPSVNIEEKSETKRFKPAFLGRFLETLQGKYRAKANSLPTDPLTAKVDKILQTLKSIRAMSDNSQERSYCKQSLMKAAFAIDAISMADSMSSSDSESPPRGNRVGSDERRPRSVRWLDLEGHNTVEREILREIESRAIDTKDVSLTDICEIIQDQSRSFPRPSEGQTSSLRAIKECDCQGACNCQTTPC